MQELSDLQKYVILEKGTEPPFKNKYDKFFDAGIYVCAQCYNPLFYSATKFNSSCGWPAFDTAMKDSLKETPDTYNRTCVDCMNCKGHVGHVFFGERFTKANRRYCANSASMQFIPDNEYLYGYFREEVSKDTDLSKVVVKTPQNFTFIRLKPSISLEEAIKTFNPEEMVCYNDTQLALARKFNIKVLVLDE